MDDVFTPGKVARLCEVAPRTVDLWIDRGLLKGYRLPTRGKVAGHRRVRRGDLVAFLFAHGMEFALRKLGVVKSDGSDGSD